MTGTRFLRWAEWVADFGSPFYQEERQRDVWNEASALGLQASLWLGLIAASAMVWIGGRTGLPYALATFMVAVVSALAVTGYAQRLGVRATSLEARSWPRLAVWNILYAVFLGGVIRAEWGAHGFGRGLVLGGVLGSLLGMVMVAWRVRPASAVTEDGEVE